MGPCQNSTVHSTLWMVILPPDTEIKMDLKAIELDVVE